MTRWIMPVVLVVLLGAVVALLVSRVERRACPPTMSYADCTAWLEGTR